MVALAERLQEIHSRVRQRHTFLAGALLEELIADVADGTGPRRIVATPRRTNGRRASPPDCRFGLRYSARGQVTRNRKHGCGPECSWSAREALDWNPPYKVSIGGEHVELHPRLVPVLPCARCDRRAGDHWEAVCDADGHFQGFRAIKECEYEPANGGKA